jgi:LacI family transcriptional regulator
MAAGVSPITVSRVLNRSPLVTAETAERVRAVLDKTGYRRNQSASNLRSGRTVTMVGLVVSDIGNPFAANLGRAVEIEAQRRGALLVVASCGDDPVRERDVVTTLFERGLDGLLMYPTVGDHGYLREELTEKRPIVLLGRRPSGIDTDSILVDNVGAAARAVKHLLAHGHRRIGLIGYGHGDEAPADPAADHRYGRIEGYRRALATARVPYDAQLVRQGCDGAASAEAAARELLALPDPPTALFTTNNRMTVGALRALGIGLGGTALVGFDDFELADVFDPPITVVAQDPTEMGRRAARLLFDRLDGADGPTVRANVPMRLVPRGSGELPPRQ